MNIKFKLTTCDASWTCHSILTTFRRLEKLSSNIRSILSSLGGSYLMRLEGPWKSRTRNSLTRLIQRSLKSSILRWFRNPTNSRSFNRLRPTSEFRYSKLTWRHTSLNIPSLTTKHGTASFSPASVSTMQAKRKPQR